jgi:hypothetical protein
VRELDNAGRQKVDAHPGAPTGAQVRFASISAISHVKSRLGMRRVLIPHSKVEAACQVHDAALRGGAV